MRAKRQGCIMTVIHAILCAERHDANASPPICLSRPPLTFEILRLSAGRLDALGLPVMFAGIADRTVNGDDSVVVECHDWTAPHSPLIIFIPDHLPVNPSALSFVGLVTVCFSNTLREHAGGAIASYLIPIPQSDAPFYVVCSRLKQHDAVKDTWELRWYIAITWPREGDGNARAIFLPVVGVTMPEAGTLVQYVPNERSWLFEEVFPPIAHRFKRSHDKLPFYPASQSCILVFDHDKLEQETELYEKKSTIPLQLPHSGMRTRLSSDRLKLDVYQAIEDARPRLAMLKRSFAQPLLTLPLNLPRADPVQGERSRTCEQGPTAPIKPRPTSELFLRPPLNQLTAPLPALIDLASVPDRTDGIEEGDPKTMPTYQILTLSISPATWTKYEACAYDSHVRPASSQRMQTWSQGMRDAAYTPHPSLLPSLSYSDFSLMIEKSAARAQSFSTEISTSTSATTVSDLASNDWTLDDSSCIYDSLGAGKCSEMTGASDCSRSVRDLTSSVVTGGKRVESPQAVFTPTSDPKVLVRSSHWTAPHSPLYMLILNCVPQCQGESFFKPLTVCYSEDMSVDTNGQAKYLISMPRCAGAIYAVCFREEDYNALSGECKLRWYTMMISQLPTSELKHVFIVPIDEGVEGCEYPSRGRLVAYEPNEESSSLFEDCFPPIPHNFVMSSNLRLYPDPAACILIIDGAMYSEEAFNFATFGSVQSSRPAPATRWALSTDCRSVFEYWAKHLRQLGRSCPVGLAASEPENKNANEWQTTAFPFAQQAYQPSWQPSTFTPKGPRFYPLPLHATAPHAGWDTGYLSEVTQRKSLDDDARRRKEVAPLPSVYSVWVMEGLPRTCTPPPALQQTALALPVTPDEPPRGSRIDALEFESPRDRRPQRSSSEPPIRRPVSPLLPIRHRLHEPAPSPPGPPIDWFTFVPDLPILSPPPPRGRASLQGLELPTDPQAYERTYDQAEEYDSESPDEDIALHGWVPLVQERTRQLPFTPITGPDTPAPPSTPVEQSPPLDPGATQVPSPARPAPFVCQREVHHGPCVPASESSVVKPGGKARVKMRSSASPERKEMAASANPTAQSAKERRAGLRAHPKKRQLG